MTCRLASQSSGGRCPQGVALAVLGGLLKFEIDFEATLTFP